MKVKEEGFITVALELRAQKLEEPTIIVETELDEKLEEKLREEFKNLGPRSDNYAKWKKRALEDGTLKKSLDIDGGDIVIVTKEEESGHGKNTGELSCRRKLSFIPS